MYTYSKKAIFNMQFVKIFSHFKLSFGCVVSSVTVFIVTFTNSVVCVGYIIFIVAFTNSVVYVLAILFSQ